MKEEWRYSMNYEAEQKYGLIICGSSLLKIQNNKFSNFINFNE